MLGLNAMLEMQREYRSGFMPLELLLIEIDEEWRECCRSLCRDEETLYSLEEFYRLRDLRREVFIELGKRQLVPFLENSGYKRVKVNGEPSKWLKSAPNFHTSSSSETNLELKGVKCMHINEYNKAKEKELREMWDSGNEFKVQGRILGILEELEEARKYWRKRYDEGGIADTRLDRFDSLEFDNEIDIDDEFLF